MKYKDLLKEAQEQVEETKKQKAINTIARYLENKDNNEKDLKKLLETEV